MKAKEKCRWCGAEGTIIGKEYYPSIIAHCDKCHHEWPEINSERWNMIGKTRKQITKKYSERNKK